MISIITTTLNSEIYIRDTLRSIASQDFKKMEYIVVDGGSEDDTLKIVREFKFAKSYSLPGSSMYEAIDFGFRKSTGEILGWLNSDDVYKDYTINFVAEQFDKNDIDILTGSCEFVNKEGDLLYPYYYWLANKLFVDSFKDLLVCQPSTFFSRELYFKIGGLNMDYEIVSDRDFFIRAFRTGRVKKVLDILCEFRIHGDNLSSIQRQQAIEENKRINNTLKAGPKGIKKTFLYYLGHFILKGLNPEMVLYKLKNNKRNMILQG